MPASCLAFVMDVDHLPVTSDCIPADAKLCQKSQRHTRENGFKEWGIKLLLKPYAFEKVALAGHGHYAKLGSYRYADAN